MSPSIIAEDEEAFAALKAIANYAPSNAAYSLAAIEGAYQELQGARTVEVQADAAAKAASDNVVEKQANFHDLIIGSKDQVTAQFGRNSNEAQSVGRKKPSERRAPQRKSKKGSGGNTGS
jgi:alkanesulfonate monooxygenase SsuD/methylene tetrahydromethanopterin reductase-like flavin-dependent oxidoreductase (luciferase family)